MSKVIPSLTPSYMLGDTADIQTYTYTNIIKTVTPGVTCPDLIFDVTMTDGSAIDATVFKFDAALGRLTTETSDSKKA